MRWMATKASMPDDEMQVLVALADGEVWTGYHDEDGWHYASDDLIEGEVTHWMEFPAPPEAGSTEHAENTESKGAVCLRCGGYGWVCENHPEKAWAAVRGVVGGCECGAGMACPECLR